MIECHLVLPLMYRYLRLTARIDYFCLRVLEIIILNHSRVAFLENIIRPTHVQRVMLVLDSSHRNAITTCVRCQPWLVTRQFLDYILLLARRYLRDRVVLQWMSLHVLLKRIFSCFALMLVEWFFLCLDQIIELLDHCFVLKLRR